MKTVFAILLINALAIAQSTEPGERWLQQAQQDVHDQKLPKAESDLRKALALWNQVWNHVEPKPPEYLEALGLLGVIVEGRLIKTPNDLRTELEPLLDETIHRIMSPGFPGSGLMAARVLDVYGILLQRTERETEAAPFFARAKALRFPQNQEPSGVAPLKIGDGIAPPRLRHKLEPEYAEDARIAKRQGTVVLSVVVDENGAPRDIGIVRSLGLGLDEKAVECVKQWVFKPALKEGVPVPVQVTIEVNFRLL